MIYIAAEIRESDDGEVFYAPEFPFPQDAVKIEFDGTHYIVHQAGDADHV